MRCMVSRSGRRLCSSASAPARSCPRRSATRRCRRSRPSSRRLRRRWSTSRRAARCANSGAIRCSRIRSFAASSMRRNSAPRERQFQSAGSGVIVDAKQRLHHHQRARHRERRRDHRDAARRPADQGEDRRPRQAFRRRAAEGHREEPRRDAAGRFEQGGGRRLRARDRQSVRAQPHGDLRHHQRARPLRQQPRVVPGLHPDRCADQSRQFRRRAGRICKASWSA